MAKEKSPADKELDAMRSILHALNELDGDSVQRVLEYVFNRLSIDTNSRIKQLSSLPTSTPLVVESHAIVRRPSIRDLKESKRPESSNQMAALVAYFLTEVADENEHKETVSTADIERYFKQAHFKLPKSLPQTLQNATAAGYFDAIGNGQYRLNAVGYNLVAHGLPRDHNAVPTKSKTKGKPRARK